MSLTTTKPKQTIKSSVIDYWSYSSMSSFLRNQLDFKKKYILKVYDDPTSPSALVGQACHKAIELYFKGQEADAAIGEGLKLINQTSDAGIDYGKTGSREKILSEYNQAINMFFEEMPTPHEVLGVEEGITADCKTITGDPLSLPLKSFSDLIVRNRLGELEVWDWKFIRSYTDADVDDFTKMLQAMFNYHTVAAKYGEAPKRMVFQECKITKNRDNTPQVQPYTIEFDQHIADFPVFYKLLDGCTTEVNRQDKLFLPNPGDIFSGQNSFEIFRSGVIGIDQAVKVKHKTEQAQFVDKKYVASSFDRPEAADYSDEEKIRLKLQEFGIAVDMRDTHVGAAVTQFTFKPSKGVTMSKIAKLDKDLALALSADSLRVEAPIRGTDLVGVEIPSKERKKIDLADKHLIKGTLSIPIGVDVYGNIVHKSLADMPHLLIAGATGAGKSVMINTIVNALTKQMTPKQMRLVLVDPKQVELAHFEQLPHLGGKPVVTENAEVETVIAELVDEMEQRYSDMRAKGCREIDDYNAKGGAMQRVVVVIDEFADLMMTSADGWAEKMLVRLAQKARAVGIHLILATQRPSVDVVTGLLKANIPTKICFMTTSRTNSQIVLDANGAEELTGKGDMLFADPSKRGLQRLQGLYS